MTSILSSVVVDSRDPAALARFWSAALGYAVLEADEEGVTIGPADGSWPVIDFVPVPEPKTVKNRLHLDLRADDGDQASEVARLEALGARRADVGQGPEVSWVVLADPEGNEFCVLRLSAAEARAEIAAVTGAGTSPGGGAGAGAQPSTPST
ncbi:lactoylglutathione lyase [Kocuria dechangensis]|uniref:Lactoylglutathione lyase n=1 Tax=Kocuria dechangensis TaxID=1176249 RepID=A0A917GJB7_9MICC|nr:VOC family protein [Kocuria dechangensis]GGG48057.1 lactoylglutathione lyase [Kocuria dechangensis]